MPHRRRHRPGRAAPAAVAVALLVLGCGNGDDGDGDADAAVEVTVEGFAFDPGVATVAVGDTVAWTNADDVAHTVTAGEPGAPADDFDEQVGASGGTASITFDEAGTVAYFCTFHPNMTGEVEVE